MLRTGEKAQVMAHNEQTPLLVEVRVLQPQPRYTHSTLRRFCTFALAGSLLAVAVLFLIPLTWLLGHHEYNTRFMPWSSPYPHQAWPQSEGLHYKELQDILLRTPKEEKAREWSQYYTAGPHLAGKNLSQAIWTRERWQEFGIQDTNIVAYDVYINYPVSHRLALLEKVANDDAIMFNEGNPEATESVDYKVICECKLEEDVLEADTTSGLENRIPTFHGYSASGNVTAQFVFVNFGTYGDFEDLVRANVSLAGKIAIVKYGRNFRGLKVKRAQELGMVGVVIYTDPQEDGNITEANGYDTYPNGPARNPSSVQRGSVEYLSISMHSSSSVTDTDFPRCSSW